MTNDEQFGRSLAAWLDEEARNRVPAHLDEVLVHTTATRQRPWWSSPERWLPVQTTTLRLSPAPRVIWILVVLALVIALGAVGALVVGSRQHPLPPPFGPARNGVIVYGGSGPRHPCPGPGDGRHDLVDRRVRGRPSSRDLARRDEAPVPAGHDDPGPGAGRSRAGDHGGERGRQQRQATDRRHRERCRTHPQRRLVRRWLEGRGVLRSPVRTPSSRCSPSTAPSRRSRSTSMAGPAEYLAFRPGDRELIFRGMNATDPAGMFAVGADGQGFRTIIAPAEGDGASLSPDGTKIAYQTWDGTLGIIHIVDVDTGLDSVPAFDPPASAGLADDKATWSPDGTRLVFLTYTRRHESAERGAGDRRSPRPDRTDDADV